MSFLDELNKQRQEQEAKFSNTRNDVHYPSQDLKNPMLRFSKKTPVYTVRILPPVVAGDNYNVPIRSIWLNTRKPSNPQETLSANVVLPELPTTDSKVDVELAKWQANGTAYSSYPNTKPKQLFLVNVVPVIQDAGTGAMMEKRDAQGNLEVHVMELPFSACSALNEQLSNTFNRPAALNQQGIDPSVAEYSFISALAAYPVSISRPAPGTMSYSVQVHSGYPLGALPDGWENSLENLTNQAKPTQDFNGDFLDYMIDAINGVPHNNQASAQTQTAQAPNFTQPQNVVPNFAPEPNRNYNNTPITDDELPFAKDPVIPAQPVQQAPVQQVVNQQPVQQQQVPVQQPVQQAPVADNNVPSVSDLLANMGVM
jgi:hypothetical protein